MLPELIPNRSDRYSKRAACLHEIIYTKLPVMPYRY